MVEELRRAIVMVEKLSEIDQRAIAQLILDEINCDQSLRKSERQLSILAEETLKEYRAGKIQPLF